jgi:hypothetical protein
MGMPNKIVRQHKQQEFFDLAERFRRATDPAEVRRLGDQMGEWFSAANAEDPELGRTARANS